MQSLTILDRPSHVLIESVVELPEGHQSFDDVKNPWLSSSNQLMIAVGEDCVDKFKTVVA